MNHIKSINTQRLTGLRFIELTAAQWEEFIKTGEFFTRVYPTYSLCVTDVLFLACKLQPEMFTFNLRKEVIVHKIEKTHSDVRNGGYNEVLFSTNKFEYK